MAKAGRYRIWEDIAAILRAEITSGQWEPDQVLPSQSELAERFEVQTLTVGKALQQLTAEGLLYAPHGLRERRVASQRSKSHRATGFLEDPAWSAPRIETVWLKVETPPAAVHASMPDSETLLHWKTQQWDGPELVALSDAWYYPQSWLMDYALHPGRNAFYDRLACEHKTKIRGFHECVHARIATTDERRLFQEPGRSALPVFVIEREAVTETDSILEVVTLVDRASRYVLDYWVGKEYT